MTNCPVCQKQIPETEHPTVSDNGACGVCGLSLTTERRATEYEQTDEERAKLAEIKRLHKIAYGPAPKSTQMTKMKGLLATLIIVLILVYAYIADQKHKESTQLNRIAVTYRTFNVLFGPSSSLSEEEKVEEFKHWRMSPVTWKGVITYVNTGQDGDLYLAVEHPTRHPSSNVLVRFEENWRDRLGELKVGQTIRYTGRISDFDRGTSFIALKQGGIIGEPR